MYPIFRLAWEFFEHRNAPPLDLTGTHISHHRCWPWDVDMFGEMNNGRVLTIYDLGRLPIAPRVGLAGVLWRNKWALAMAGACVRYRRRVLPFQRFEMRSRAVCFDDRFMYIEQSMWRKGECLSHILYRSAVTNKGKIVPTDEVLREMGFDPVRPEVPEWIAAWIAAEDKRPWPPEM